MDYDIWRAIWRWAKRRHPNKSGQWVRERYFHQNAARNWAFSTDLSKQNQSDQPKPLELKLASDTRIKRHLKIRDIANPFDNEWKLYFDKRSRSKIRYTNQ